MSDISGGFFTLSGGPPPQDPEADAQAFRNDFVDALAREDPVAIAETKEALVEVLDVAIAVEALDPQVDIPVDEEVKP